MVNIVVNIPSELQIQKTQVQNRERRKQVLYDKKQYAN